MENVKIYLAGAMASLSFEEQTKWRQQISDEILYGGHDYKFKPIFIDPTRYYNFENPSHKSEKEVMNFDLHKVRTSDVVVVNFNDPNSLGTAMEIAIAYENRIPVIGLNKDDAELHSWLVKCCDRVCDDMYEVVEHIVDFYLN